jgi:outer membrane protein assembly factor BamB
MANLLAKISIGCHYSVTDCPVPGFSGSDSSPSFDPHTGVIIVGSYDSHVYRISSTPPYDILSKIKGPGGEDSPSLLPNSWFGWGGLQGSEAVAYSLDPPDEHLWSWSPTRGGITTSAADPAGNICYAGTSDDGGGVLTALNCTDGAFMWVVDMGGEQWGTLGPGFSRDGDGDVVCVGVGGSANLFKDVGSKLACLRGGTGEVIWETELGKQIQSRPSFGDGAVYVGDYNGCLYKLGMDEGAVLWERCFKGIGGSTWLTNVEGSSSVLDPVDSNGKELVFITSFTGFLYALNGSTGSIEWQLKLGKPYVLGGGAASTPHVDAANRNVYVGGPTGVWAVEADTGKVIWEHETNTMCGSSPTTVEDDAIAIACEDGCLYVLAK